MPATCGKHLDILHAFTVPGVSDADALNICVSKYCLPSGCGLLSEAIFVATFHSEGVSRLDHLSIINRL